MWGLYIVLAVLVDTFLVRSLVVPAVMGLFGDANWWPGKGELLLSLVNFIFRVFPRPVYN